MTRDDFKPVLQEILDEINRLGKGQWTDAELDLVIAIEEYLFQLRLADRTTSRS